MADRRVTAMYFSPSGTTERVVAGVARRLADRLGGGVEVVDFTLPAARQKPAAFGPQDVVVFGVPVYAGRAPNLLVKYMGGIAGNGAAAVAIVVYGHRAYEDALIELADILTADGFAVIGGGAFIGQHCFSKTLAKGRPDEQDMAAIHDFADRVAAKLAGGAKERVAVKGARPYRKHYAPPKRDGEPIDIRKVKPKTSAACIDCKLCADVCPMGAIDRDDVASVPGTCIKCSACVNRCPVEAKYYDDADFLDHVREVEDQNMAPRKEPEVFV